MALSVGIVGLPNVGKSTLFNALLKRRIAQVAEYPFTTIEPNMGMVEVFDKRLTELLEITKGEKLVPAAIKFIDIAGLVKNAHLGEGLGNQFLSHIREVDVVLHVLRFYDHPKAIHVMENNDPKRDLEIVNLEFILKDLETVEKRVLKLQKEIKMSGEAGDKAQKELAFLKEIQKGLEAGQLVSQVNLLDEAKDLVSQLFLLSTKPVLYVLNVDEKKLTDWCKFEKARDTTHVLTEDFMGLPASFFSDYKPIVVCARLEEELTDFSVVEQQEYLTEVGVDKLALDKVISSCYKLLGFVTMFTIAGSMVQAWPIKQGVTVLEAAEKIHADFAKNFIKAEVINFEILAEVGDYRKAKENGLVKFEGRDYIVQDGDVVTIKI